MHTKLVNRTLALARLAELSGEIRVTCLPGPASLGYMGQDLSDEIKRAAGLYCAAFNAEIQTYPYIREQQ